LDAEKRFHSKIVIDKDTACWLWTGTRNRNKGGYGKFHLQGKRVLAHRFSYELFKGIIPQGLTIDHLCKITHCVNPEHLEAVTMKENVLRGEGFAAQNAKKVFCLNGHLLEGDNLYLRPDGDRDCKACKREAFKKFKYKKYGYIHSPKIANRKKRVNASSKYRGVSFHGKIGKWTARISKGCKQYNIGVFGNEVDAAIAYNLKAHELYGDFARLNIVTVG
jgi:hypothetical protein